MFILTSFINILLQGIQNKNLRSDWQSCYQHSNPLCVCLLWCLQQEKVQYYDIATEKRADFDRAMADYIKRKVYLAIHVLQLVFVLNACAMLTQQQLYESCYLLQESGEDQETEDSNSEFDEQGWRILVIGNIMLYIIFRIIFV